MFFKKINKNLFSSNIFILYNVDDLLYKIKLNNILCILLKSKKGIIYLFSKNKYKSILLYFNNKVFYNPFFNILETYPKWLKLKIF